MCEDVKACRRCGQIPKVKSKIIDREWGGPACWAVLCSCGLRTNLHNSKEQAVARWNRIQTESEEQ